MKNRIRCHTLHPTTNIILQAAIEEEWNAFTAEDIASMVSSMSDRVTAVVNIQCRHTGY